MSGDSKFFKLGLFVIAGIALIVGGVVLFGVNALFTDYVTVETATTDSVEGLDVGGAVKYQGVKVGKISKIEMANWQHRDADPARMAEIRKYIVIEMSIRRDMILAGTEQQMRANLTDAINKGFRVRMASSGLTGPAFLEMTFLNPADYPANPIPWTHSGLYLPSAPSTMTQIVESVEEIVSQLRHADVGKLVKDTGRLINDSDKAVEDLQAGEVREKLVALIDEARSSNRRIKEILNSEKIDKTLQALPEISAHLRSTSERLDEILHDPKIQQVIDNVQDTTASAAPTAAELRRVLRNLDQLITSQRQDLESIILNLRRILENGSAVVEDAKSNPSRVIFGEPPPHVQAAGERK